MIALGERFAAAPSRHSWGTVDSGRRARSTMIVVVGCVLLVGLMGGGLWLASRLASQVIAEGQGEAQSLRGELQNAFRQGVAEAEAENADAAPTPPDDRTGADAAATDDAQARALALAQVNEFIAAEVLGGGAAADGDSGRTVAQALDRAVATLDSGPARPPAVEAAIRTTIAASYLGLEKHDEAAAQCLAAESILRAAYGELHDYSLAALRNLGALEARRGRWTDAADWFDALANARQARFGPDDADALALRRFASDLSLRAGAIVPGAPAATWPKEIRRFLEEAPRCARFGPLEL